MVVVVVVVVVVVGLYIWPLGPENPTCTTLVPSYGWGLDYPKVLHKFRSFGKKV